MYSHWEIWILLLDSSGLLHRASTGGPFHASETSCMCCLWWVATLCSKIKDTTVAANLSCPNSRSQMVIQNTYCIMWVKNISYHELSHKKWILTKIDSKIGLKGFHAMYKSFKWKYTSLHCLYAWWLDFWIDYFQVVLDGILNAT